MFDSDDAIISLLDDDTSVLKGVGRLLSSAGWRSKEFTDSGEFLLHAATHRSLLAVLDIWMPVMNGLEVQAQLRQISPLTRVIILTAKDDPLVRSAAISAGASAFFTKPFDDEEFLTAVRLALAPM